MNVINLTGRLTREPELKYSQSGTAFVNFSLAVQRPFKHDEADFIDCVGFGKTAENIAKYVAKGHMLGVTGSLQIETYTKNDGTKGRSAKVVVSSFDFLQSKQESQPSDWQRLGEEQLTVDGMPF